MLAGRSQQPNFKLQSPPSSLLLKLTPPLTPCSQVLCGFYSRGKVDLNLDFTMYLLPHSKSISLAPPSGKSAASKQPCGHMAGGRGQKRQCGHWPHIHPLSPRQSHCSKSKLQAPSSRKWWSAEKGVVCRHGDRRDERTQDLKKQHPRE